MKRDHRHLHKTAYEAIAKDEIDDFEGLRVALQTLAPTSDFIKSLFEADGVTLKKIEPPAEKVEVDPGNIDISAATSIEEALLLFPRESTRKTKVKALLMKGFKTYDITQALRCSDGLVSGCRSELKRDFAAGIIDRLPDEILHARSIAKKGVARFDMRGERNPAVQNSKAGWGSARSYSHKAKKKNAGQF